jgi:hypothetical protein
MNRTQALGGAGGGSAGAVTEPRLVGHRGILSYSPNSNVHRLTASGVSNHDAGAVMGWDEMVTAAHHTVLKAASAGLSTDALWKKHP